MKKFTWGLIGTLMLGTLVTTATAGQPFSRSAFAQESQTGDDSQAPRTIQQLGFRELATTKKRSEIRQVDWQLKAQKGQPDRTKRYVHPAKFGDMSGQIASKKQPVAANRRHNMPQQPKQLPAAAVNPKHNAIRQVFHQGAAGVPVEYAGQPVAVVNQPVTTVNPNAPRQAVVTTMAVPNQRFAQPQYSQPQQPRLSQPQYSQAQQLRYSQPQYSQAQQPQYSQPQQVQYVTANPMQQPTLLSAIHANYVGGPGNVSQLASERRYSALLGSLGQPQLVSYKAAEGGVNIGRGGGSCDNDGDCGNGASCGTSCGTESCGSCETCCEPCCPNIFFSATYLYWQTTRSVNPYTATTNGGFDPDMNTVAFAENAKYEFSSGYRFAAGYQMCSTWDAVVRYTHFDNNGSRAINNRSFRLIPLQAHPAFVATSRFANGLDFARTRLEFDMDTIDMEIGKSFNWCDCTVRARAFGGLRWGQIDQSTFTRYVVTVNPTDTDQILLETDMEGFGLRAGGELWWDVFGRQGLALFGRGALSLLYAEFDNRRLETLTQEINRVATGSIDFRNRFDDIVPVTELAVGTEYTFRNFKIAVGYEFNMWFNMVNDARFINNTIVRRQQVLDIERGSLGLHGLFVEGTITF